MPKELSRGLDASTEINKIDQHSSQNNPAERQLSHCQCSPPRLRVADKNQDILPRPPSSVTARDKHRDDSTLPRWSVADDNDTSKKKKKKKKGSNDGQGAVHNGTPAPPLPLRNPSRSGLDSPPPFRYRITNLRWSYFFHRPIPPSMRRPRCCCVFTVTLNHTCGTPGLPGKEKERDDVHYPAQRRLATHCDGIECFAGSRGPEEPSFVIFCV